MTESEQTLKTIIDTEVLDLDYKYDHLNVFESPKWIFDFRNILLQPKRLELVTNVLYERVKDLDSFQVAGMESASIPLVASLTLKAHKEGKRVNGLYVRKSRKKSGLYKLIEGKVTDDPIVIVDDLVNSGGSLEKMVHIFEREGLKTERIVTIVLFHESSRYTFFANKNIGVESIFLLKDFGLTLRHNIKNESYTAPNLLWSYHTEHQTPFLVVSKSTPVLSDNTLYFGGDDRVFRAVEANSGKEQWRFTVGRAVLGKSILSSPCIHNETVYFGAYDGRLYALNKIDGSVRWIHDEVDSIGSSPAVSPKHGLIYIGIENSVPDPKGGLQALRADTGKKVWEASFPSFTHASPLVIEEHNQVIIGGNEGRLYSYTADKGKLLWEFVTPEGLEYRRGGFSAADIKLRPAYCDKTDAVAFACQDGYVYVLERQTGALRFKTTPSHKDISVPIGIWCTPWCGNGKIVYGGQDKIVYCFDNKTAEKIWQYETAGRIFSSPVVHNNHVFIGSNDGALYRLSLDTGKLTHRMQFEDRILCPVIIDSASNKLFVPFGGGSVTAIEFDTKT